MKILFNILEYFPSLNFAANKSPNNVHKVNDTQLLTVKIAD